MLKREGREKGLAPVNAKRVHRVMKAHGMLLQRHAGGADARRHDGKIAVAHSNLRWCSDGFELACDNGEKVRVAFALDCCDREAMAWVATTQGIKGEDVRDLMVASVKFRFGQINRLPRTIEWLSDNGSGYIAKETRAFAREIGLGAADDARHQPAIQRHGRGLRADDQARLCPRQSIARRQDRHRKLAALVRPLQHRSPAQRFALSIAARVHRRAIKQGGRVRF